MALQGYNTLAHPSGANIVIVDNLLEFMDGFLKNLPIKYGAKGDTSTLHFRPQSGSGSQNISHQDLVWVPSTFAKWGAIKERYNPILIFVVNLNRTAIQEKARYDQGVAAGMVYSYIELGNETYLKKYTKAAGSAPEVTARTEFMTPNKYLTLCLQYVTQFVGEGLPFLIQLAQNGKGTLSQVATNNAWNSTVIAAVNSQPNPSIYQYTLHVYSPEAQLYDLSTIGVLKTAIGVGKRLFITEYGARADTGVAQGGGDASDAQRELELAQGISAQLGATDVMMSHTLWNQYQDDSRWTASYWKEETNIKAVYLEPFIFSLGTPAPPSGSDLPPSPLLVRSILQYITPKTFVQWLTFADGSKLTHSKGIGCKKKVAVPEAYLNVKTKAEIILEFFPDLIPAEPE